MVLLTLVQLLRKMQRLRRKEVAYPDWEVLQISHRTTKAFGQPFISSLSISHDFFYMVHGDRLVLKSKRFYSPLTVSFHIFIPLLLHDGHFMAQRHIIR